AAGALNDDVELLVAVLLRLVEKAGSNVGAAAGLARAGAGRAGARPAAGKRRDGCEQGEGGNESRDGTTPAASPKGARTVLTASVPSAPERAFSDVARRLVVSCQCPLRSFRSAARWESGLPAPALTLGSKRWRALPRP